MLRGDGVIVSTDPINLFLNINIYKKGNCYYSDGQPHPDGVYNQFVVKDGVLVDVGADDDINVYIHCNPDPCE